MQKEFIPDRFTDFVAESLVHNFLATPGTPVLSGVFGPPGSGKSFQIRAICGRAGVDVVSIDAADLESDRAGQPGKYIRRTYGDALSRLHAGEPVCLLLDDFDTTGGEWSQHTGTINHLQVLAELMHLADDPHVAENKSSRPPIFFTGNDFGKLYPPLSRPGRMRSLYWVPEGAEKKAILAGMFKDQLTPGGLDSLISDYRDASIAFFSEVRATAIDLRCRGVVKTLFEDLAEVCRSPERSRTYLDLEVRSASLDREVRIAARTISDTRNRLRQSFVEPT